MDPRYAQLNDVRLHYMEEGEGPVVVLLHGFPDFWYSWRHQMPALAAAGYRAVAPDMRGFGLSDKPYRVSDYSLDRLAADVAGLVAHLGESSATIVGHDWGGVVAWATAAWHPDLVERLVVMNAPHPDDYARGLRNPRQIAKSWYTGFFQMPGAAALLERDGYAALRKAVTGSSLPGSFTDEDIERYVEAWSEPRAIRSQLAYYRAAARRMFGRSERLPVVTVRTLVVWGERDRALEPFFATPPPELVTDLSVEMISDATHWVHLDRAEHVNRAVLDFLA